MTEIDLDKEFHEAYEKVSSLEENIAPDNMLKLYAYYKQAVKGDLHHTNKHMNIHTAFKMNAWVQLKGMSSQEAKKSYIELVNTLTKNT